MFACARQNQFVVSKFEKVSTSWDRKNLLQDDYYRFRRKPWKPLTELNCFELARLKGFLKIVDVYVAKNTLKSDQEDKRMLEKTEYQLTDKGREFIRRNGNV